jgi:hypothetical protein
VSRKFEAAHFRHVKVKENPIEPLSFHQGGRSLAVTYRLDLDICGREHVAHQFQDYFIIFDDKYFKGHGIHQCEAVAGDDTGSYFEAY